jgi:CheY-like chemotaxis protein
LFFTEKNFRDYRVKEKPHILIVDSNFNNLSQYKNLLESNDYVVLTAQHTEDAINIYRQQQNYIQAIILNLNLSGKTYFFSIPAFFAINKAVKIIALSDSLEKTELSSYFKTKLFDFIEKPFREELLIQSLEKISRIKK